MPASRIRTRFAPSPTGYLHIGGARTALYAYLFAKKHGGDFLLRIEDTDQNRLVEGSVEALIRALHTLHIHNDEGPQLQDESIVEIGEYGPYKQSQRLDIYMTYIQQLVDKGVAYYSFKTPEELDEIKKKLDKTHTALKRVHLNETYTPEEVSTKVTQGEKFVIRLQTPIEGSVVVHDAIKGDVTFHYKDVDDQVLLKSDGFPTYHLASVVDDHLMKISHVIRGDEWLPSTPKHIFLYESFGWELPVFAHLPLILNPDKTKLSKRQGDVAIEDYLEKGYLPETLINFISLLGWNPGEGSTQEFFSLQELITEFSIEKVNSSGAVLDVTKLNWMNGKYLREKISIDEFLLLIQKDLETLIEQHPNVGLLLEDRDKLLYLAQLIRERIDTVSQAPLWFGENQWLTEVVQYPAEKLQWKKSTLADAYVKLYEIKELLLSFDEEVYRSVEKIEQKIKEWISEREYGVGDVLWPLRYALTGQEKSPNPFEVIYILGQEEVIERITQALHSNT